jgi:uncharacterized membrane protein
MWWGMALGNTAQSRGWTERFVVPVDRPGTTVIVGIGRWSLSWYMVHQPVLIGALTVLRRTLQ